MLTHCVVVPDAPVLIPSLGGASEPLDRWRSDCVSAVRAADSEDAVWVVVGAGERSESIPADTVARLSSFGGTGSVSFSDNAVRSVRCPSPAVIVAGWLREQAGVTTVTAELVSPDVTAAENRALGAKLRAAATHLLVLGSGTFTWEPTDAAPVAEVHPIDDMVAKALSAGDLSPVTTLDADVCRNLRVTGRAPWQVLAGATETADITVDSAMMGAPYGVAYHLASWRIG